MKKRLTILDIANLSGVGKSTVSRFFNNGYVSPEAREKIQKVIDENSYAPNLFARGIKARNNKFIGIIVPCLDSNITSDILMVLDSNLREAGYIPLIINTNHNIELEKTNLENLWRLNVEGIVVISTEVTEEHKDFIKRTKVPTLFVGQICSNGYSILNHEEAAGKKIGEYIGKSGRKNILYIGVDESDITVGVKRRDAVFKGLSKFDVKIQEIKSDFSFETTEKLILEYLKDKRPDCIISATDNMAFGAMKAIKHYGLTVPKDISIASFGGYKVSEVISPKLTTIRFYNDETGKNAAKTIIQLINGEKIPKIQKIEFDFVEGESVSKI